MPPKSIRVRKQSRDARPELDLSSPQTTRSWSPSQPITGQLLSSILKTPKSPATTVRNSVSFPAALPVSNTDEENHYEAHDTDVDSSLRTIITQSSRRRSRMGTPRLSPARRKAAQARISHFKQTCGYARKALSKASVSKKSNPKRKRPAKLPSDSSTSSGPSPPSTGDETHLPTKKLQAARHRRLVDSATSSKTSPALTQSAVDLKPLDAPEATIKPRASLSSTSPGITTPAPKGRKVNKKGPRKRRGSQAEYADDDSLGSSSPGSTPPVPMKMSKVKRGAPGKRRDSQAEYADDELSPLKPTRSGGYATRSRHSQMLCFQSSKLG